MAKKKKGSIYNVDFSKIIPEIPVDPDILDGNIDNLPIKKPKKKPEKKKGK